VSDVPARTFVELCEANAVSAADAEAVVDDRGSRLTYGDLYREALSFARGLRAGGVQPGQTVALLAPNRAEWIISALGAQLAGARVAAFHTWVKAHDLDFLLGHSEAETLVVASTVGDVSLLGPLRELIPELWQKDGDRWRSQRYPALQRVVVLGDDRPDGATDWEAVVRAGRDDQSDLGASVDAGDVAFILYTSGSTADPKGVPLLHGDMVANGFHIGERMGITPSDRVWLGSPLFWSFGSANAMTATFTHRAALVLQGKFDAETAAEQIAEERCSAAYLLPALAHAFSNVPDVRRAFETVRTGLTIGRPDEVETVAVTLGVEEICNVYGSTETYGNCCVTPHDMPLADRMRCQGPPLPGVSIRIVDPASGDVLAAGAEGAVEVRGRITPGYWKAPELDAETFTADGWYRSGDRGRLDPDGNFTFVTRHSDMIKTSGINVSPAEVESFILSHPAVAEVVVVGAPDPDRDEVVVAFVRPEAGRDLDVAEIISFCRRNLASYKVPRQVRQVESMPQTATGKLSRKQLREVLAAGEDPFAATSGPADPKQAGPVDPKQAGS
jgi:fatty-acyl-CoA synthase